MRPLLLLALLLPLNAHAVTVQDSWATTTLGAQTSAAAYFTLVNDSNEPRQLTAISTPLGEAELHQTSMEHGMMSMEPVKQLTIPAHGTLSLKPGGQHVMLTGLKKPITPGEKVLLSLKLDKGETLTLSAPAQSMREWVKTHPGK